MCDSMGLHALSGVGDVILDMCESSQVCVSVCVSIPVSGDVRMCEIVYEWIHECGCVRMRACRHV